MRVALALEQPADKPECSAMRRQSDEGAALDNTASPYLHSSEG